MGISANQTDDYTALNAETLQRVRLLVVHRDGQIYAEGRRSRTITVRGSEIDIVSEPNPMRRKVKRDAVRWLLRQS